MSKATIERNALGKAPQIILDVFGEMITHTAAYVGAMVPKLSQCPFGNGVVFA